MRVFEMSRSAHCTTTMLTKNAVLYAQEDNTCNGEEIQFVLLLLLSYSSLRVQQHFVCMHIIESRYSCNNIVVQLRNYDCFKWYTFVRPE